MQTEATQSESGCGGCGSGGCGCVCRGVVGGGSATAWVRPCVGVSHNYGHWGESKSSTAGLVHVFDLLDTTRAEYASEAVRSSRILCGVARRTKRLGTSMQP